jgi:hypothetical protein
MAATEPQAKANITRINDLGRIHHLLESKAPPTRFSIRQPEAAARMSCEPVPLVNFGTNRPFVVSSATVAFDTLVTTKHWPE